MTGFQRFGSSSAVRGARRRVADAGWSVVQTPVAAGLAWYIAHTLLGHHDPFFAPTAAAVALSKTRVLRGQRALQLIVGVVLGIGVGTAVKAVAGSTPGGSGAVAIGVAAMIALFAAPVVGGGFFEQGVLFVNQSATSAILMIAVTGNRRAARYARGTVRSGPDARPGMGSCRGQRIHHQLAGLQEACTTARQVAGFAPRRFPERSAVRRVSEQAATIDLLVAGVLSLAHASTSGPGAQPPPSSALRAALAELTSAFAALAEGGDTNAAQAASHAIRVRALATGGGGADGRRAPSSRSASSSPRPPAGSLSKSHWNSSGAIATSTRVLVSSSWRSRPGRSRNGRL
jgi:hypothetical protein